MKEQFHLDKIFSWVVVAHALSPSIGRQRLAYL